MSNTEITITVNQLAILVNAVNLAQKRGTFSIEESSVLLDPVTQVTKFVNTMNANAKKEAENNETSENNETAENKETTKNETSENNEVKTIYKI